MITQRRMNLVFAGAGIGYRRQYRDELLSETNDPKPSVLEVIPGHFFSNPEALAPLAGRYKLVFHEINLSPGTKGQQDKMILDRVRDLMRFGRPILFTDHLALTRSPDGLDIGHLAPVWFTHEILNIVAERVCRWQDLLGVPVALENIAMPFGIPNSEMTETEFFFELTERTGCGMLLDVTNLLMNSRNFGYDPFERIIEYPLHRVQQVHLAGGKAISGWWTDSHSESLERKSYELLDRLRGKAPLLTAIVERDANLPELTELVFEARRVEKIWKDGLTE